MVHAQEKKVDKDDIFGQTLDLHVSILFLTPPMLQTSDFERSERYCHYKSDNYITIPRMCKSKELAGVLLAVAFDCGATCLATLTRSCYCFDRLLNKQWKHCKESRFHKLFCVTLFI